METAVADLIRKVSLSPADMISTRLSMMNEQFSLGAEQFQDDRYLDAVIPKPWGHEYRIYADQLYDIWQLLLLPGQETSLHCHLRKETVLFCLAGEGIMHFLGHGEQPVRPLDCIYIAKGVFHATENSGAVPLELIEVEVPRNKLDLVRLRDPYGRSGQQYETHSLDYSMYTLQPGRVIDRSKLRPTSLATIYRFEVRGGLDLLCQPVNNVLCIIPLSLRNAIEQSVQVFPAPVGEHLLSFEGYYFVISKTDYSL